MMDKSILSLIILGIALAIVHVPHMSIMVGIIVFLLIVTTKLLWGALTSYSSSANAPRL
ncbi:MAG: hypothetical protein HLUCCA11_03260 [Phormidesmis priestleyi Ana]|uniref:Uncharacterized protein n=1 Tax=Phormidesmis priestleyi Ana TaxID=1666911 RepID=A0A0P8C5F0_9CYAN|nr:MAG: hypothetical protein HLUCCA11_03260 [Phormidesmis priestleyi Ana]